MEFQNWKQDPRLRSMDPDKIKQMEQLADQARNTPQDKLLPLLMSLRGSNGSPQFSTSEMDTLFSILTDQLLFFPNHATIHFDNGELVMQAEREPKVPTQNLIWIMPT